MVWQRYFFQIEDWHDKLDSKFILEIGIDGGDILAYLAKKNNVYAVDINTDIINRAKKMITNVKESHYIKGNARNLPFKPKNFDVVICREVIEHMVKREGE